MRQDEPQVSEERPPGALADVALHEVSKSRPVTPGIREVPPKARARWLDRAHPVVLVVSPRTGARLRRLREFGLFIGPGRRRGSGFVTFGGHSVRTACATTRS